jgi:hypothetical protein
MIWWLCWQGMFCNNSMKGNTSLVKKWVEETTASSTQANANELTGDNALTHKQHLLVGGQWPGSVIHQRFQAIGSLA